jgi:hypothetical protein
MSKKVYGKNKMNHREAKECKDHWPKSKEEILSDQTINEYLNEAKEDPQFKDEMQGSFELPPETRGEFYTKDINEFVTETKEVPYIDSKHVTPELIKHSDTSEGFESAIDHVANLIKEAVDEDILATIEALAKQRFRVMRIRNETKLMEWNGESWILTCTMLGDFDFTLEPDWSDESR